MRLIVLSLADRDRWLGELSGTPGADVYYTPGYLEAQERLGEGRAHLAVWTGGGGEGKVVYAFLRRVIPGRPDLCDITTPYGYGGPVYSGSRAAAAEALKRFRREFDDYCRETRVVSEFIRFHPLLGNRIGEDGEVPTQYVRDTVVIELQPDRDPLAGFPAKTRNMVRKAERSGVEIVEGPERLGDFSHLYRATMLRNNAAPYYLFPESFFRDLMDLVDPRPVLLTALWKERAVAAAMFLPYGPFLHYHFAGSDRDSQRLGPNNLVIYRACLRGLAMGVRRVHLGGGYAAPEDSLFRFKLSFSNVRVPFFVGRKVHDPETYEELCAARPGPPMDRFPAYRD